MLSRATFTHLLRSCVCATAPVSPRRSNPTYAAGSADGLTVALETTLTTELREEGLCREIINKVQNLRKKSGLEVSDRIKLRIEGPESILAVVSGYGERIASETLAVTVAADGDMPYKDLFEIEDQEISIALDRA